MVAEVDPFVSLAFAQRARWRHRARTLLGAAIVALACAAAANAGAQSRIVTLTLYRETMPIEHVPPRVGDEVGFRVAVTGDTTGGIPVRMWVNGQLSATLTLDYANMGTFWHMVSLKAGSNSIYADVANDATYAAATSNTLTETLDQGVPNFDPVGVPSGPYRKDIHTTECIGYPVFLTAQGTLPRPTGTVNVYADTQMQTLPLSTPSGAGDGCASVTIVGDALPRGPLPLDVSYSGDANWIALPRTTVQSIVDSANVTMDIKRSVVTPVTGQPVDFTITLVPAAGVSGVPDGSVRVDLPGGSSVLPLDATGKATLQASFRSYGAGIANTGGIGVHYPDRPRWYILFGSQNLPIQYLFNVDPASVKLQLDVPPGPVYAGSPVPLTVHVMPVAPSVDPPLGNVVFYQGAAASGTPVCDIPVANLTAVCTMTLPTPGYPPIHVEFNGGVAYLSTSLTVPVKVAPPPMPGPHLAVSPASIDFGSVTVGTGGPYRMVNVTNVGDVPVSLSSNVSAGFKLGSQCAPTLAPAGQCTIQVAFAPVIEGAQAGSVNIMSNASESPQHVTLAGVGTAVVPGTSPAGRVVEFYHAGLDHYFISVDATEIHDLDTGVHPNWTRTGEGFGAYMAAGSGVSPVCRFYIPPGKGDSHFFSASPTECGDTSTKFPDLVYESPNVFYLGLPDQATGACAPATIPVYRVWNNRADSNHRYTTSRATRDAMVNLGYLAEGYGPDQVVMCAPPSP